MSGETETWLPPGHRLVRELGRGRGGRVLLAVHEPSASPVAIRLLPDTGGDPDLTARRRAEARSLAGLTDPHLVTIREYAEQPAPGRATAIVSELVEGVALPVLLTTAGRLRPEAALLVLKTCLLALTAAHRAGVLHRDLRTSDVLVTRDGHCLLTGFGVCAGPGPAPEHHDGRPVTAASDLYAATAVFYECMTGGPADPAVVHRMPAIVEEPLRELVGAGLAADPRHRPESASIFLGRVEAVALTAYGVGWEDRGHRALAERLDLPALLFPGAGGMANAGPARTEHAAPFDDAPASAEDGHGEIAGADGSVLRIGTAHGDAGARSRGGRHGTARRAHRRWPVVAAVLLTMAAGTGAALYTAGGAAEPTTVAVSPTVRAPGYAPPESDELSPTATPRARTAAPTTPAATPSSSGAADRPSPPATRDPRPPRPTASAAPAPGLRVTALGVSLTRLSGSRMLAGIAVVNTTGTAPFTLTITYREGGGTVMRVHRLSGARSYSVPVQHTPRNACATVWVQAATTPAADSGTATDESGPPRGCRN